MDILFIGKTHWKKQAVPLLELYNAQMRSDLLPDSYPIHKMDISLFMETFFRGSSLVSYSFYANEHGPLFAYDQI